MPRCAFATCKNRQADQSWATVLDGSDSHALLLAVCEEHDTALRDPALVLHTEYEPTAPYERPDAPEPLMRLSERETEVLLLLARGLSNRSIAEELFISENTVKNHVRNILSTLRLHSRTEAVVYAVRRRIIALDSVPEQRTEARY